MKNLLCLIGWHAWAWPYRRGTILNLKAPPPPDAKCKRCGAIHGPALMWRPRTDPPGMSGWFYVKRGTHISARYFDDTGDEGGTWYHVTRREPQWAQNDSFDSWLYVEPIHRLLR